MKMEKRFDDILFTDSPLIDYCKSLARLTTMPNEYAFYVSGAYRLGDKKKRYNIMYDFDVEYVDRI